MSCLICGNSEVRLFKIYCNYGTVHHTVHSDLVTLFGEQIQNYLSQDHCVCNICMNMLDNVAKLKKRVWNIITNPLYEKNSKQFDGLLQLFASMKFDLIGENDEDGGKVKLESTDTSQLMQILYTEKYNKRKEDAMALQQYKKTNKVKEDVREGQGGSQKGRKSRISKRGSRKVVPDADPSASGRDTANTAKSSISICLSETTERAPSTPGRGFRSPFFSPVSKLYGRSVKSTTRSLRVVEYDDQDRLIRKRTRSVSSAMQKELESIDKSKFYCNEKNCTMYFDDLDVYTLHKVEDHQCLDTYNCYMCHRRYINAEHLRIHQRTHSTGSFHCLMCRAEMEDEIALQLHLDEHMIRSVDCKYCDMSFLNASQMNKHVMEKHKGNKRTPRIYRNMEIIVDRIDSMPIDPPNNNVSIEEEYKTVILEYEDPENNLTEYFRSNKIEFWTEEDLKKLAASYQPEESAVETTVSDNTVDKEKGQAENDTATFHQPEEDSETLNSDEAVNIEIEKETSLVGDQGQEPLTEGIDEVR